MANDEVLRLQTNVPEVIALRFTDGLAVQSKYGGDQIMFSLVDGRKMFLAPFVAKKIASSGIRPEEAFSICKREVAQGNRRVVEYQIDLVPPAPAPAVVEHHDNGRIHRVVEQRVSPAAAAPVAAPAPAPLKTTPADSSAVEFMKLAGRGAIDCALDLESYARSKGMTDFLFGAENIQKLAVTLYIDLRKGGRA